MARRLDADVEDSALWMDCRRSVSQGQEISKRMCTRLVLRFISRIEAPSDGPMDDGWSIRRSCWPRHSTYTSFTL